MARTPVLAAGGIVLRQSRPPLIAVVRLRKGNEWVLPKGKLDDGETPRDAAMREVLEETGHDVAVHEFLGTLAYDLGGRSKIVHYWRMETQGAPTRELMDDVRAVDWLPLDAAVERLSRDHERAFLANVGPLALERARRSRDKKPAPIERPRRRRPAAPKPVPSAPVMPLADDAVAIPRHAIAADALAPGVIEPSPPLLGHEAPDELSAPTAGFEAGETEVEVIRSEAIGPDAVYSDETPAPAEHIVTDDEQALRISVMQRVKSWLRRAS
jgi:8-oxo-dGTP diphosphatase